MKLKKLVSLGLATLMAAGILAGCSGSTTSESAAGDSSASESTAADSGDATLPTAPRLPARKRPSTSSSRCWATSTGACCRPAPSRPARTWAAMSSWSAPALESDIEGQLTLLQNAVSAQADGIVIAPLDPVSLDAPITEAYNSGTPIVLVDTLINSDNYSAALMTNNGGGRQDRRRGDAAPL